MPEPIHVFIDTNVWLSFYSFAKDDLEQLKKINALVQASKLKLYIPQQVVDEFYRNREGKLDDSIREFSKAQFTKSVPRYMLDYPETAAHREALEAFQLAKAALISRAKTEAEKKELAADKLFADIVAGSPPISVTTAIVGKAVERRVRNNPPGKPNTTGDQISWETLLGAVPDGTDLHVVSNDGDFESDLIPGRASQFLIDEWTNTKHGELSLHSELRPFLNAKFPEIKLAVDIEKQEAIDRLISSSNFANTHYRVSQLSPLLEHVTWAEADKLIDAALNNTQVRWIGDDEDVKSLYSCIMEKFGDKIGEARLAELNLVISPLKVEPPDFGDFDEDPPF